MRLLLFLLLLSTPSAALAQSHVSYRLTFPEPEHRWMQVEVLFTEVPAGPLELRMSRSSPGRYALHEFAKNVFDVRAEDTDGYALTVARPNPHGWDISGHDGTVRLQYKAYGNRVDGTYLAIDSTHAHMNIPASLMWARGLEARPASVQLVPPSGTRWRVATQLFPSNHPLTFTAPNLQYLMDSPIEFSAFMARTFEVPDPGGSGRTPTFHVALHHDGTEAEADDYARDVERIVREELAVFGRFPAFDGGTYTFLADYLPYANGDGMEHRNSTVLTSRGALRNAAERQQVLGTVAHEFFHAWNVERIRPRSLEPFDFEEANMSGELWLAEGITSYYDTLILQRAGLASLSDTAADFARLVNAVALSPGRQLRSAVEMSRLAPFVDAAQSTDPTYWENVFISYYTWGAAIGLGLDLSLRSHTGGAVTLDHFMRALWERYGQAGQEQPGVVTTPYDPAGIRETLAEVSKDAAFAEAFFDRYVEGREVPDYAALLANGGFVMRPRQAGRAWLGDLGLEYTSAGARLTQAAPFDSPAYEAGMDEDDVLVSLDEEAISSQERLDAILRRHRPGDRLNVTFIRRGTLVEGSVVLEEDPRVEIVPVEETGGTLTDEQREFRQQWLGSRAGGSGRQHG